MLHYRTQPRRPKQLLCPKLVNLRPCLDPRCPDNHDPGVVVRWRRSQKTHPCRRGEKCDYLVSGKCLWFHPEEHRVIAAQKRAQRMDEISQGLVDLDIITLEHLLPDDGRFVSITESKELASFNKVDDNEIAVPGLPPFFILTGFLF